MPRSRDLVNRKLQYTMNPIWIPYPRKCYLPHKMTMPHQWRATAPSQSVRQYSHLAINTRAVKNAEISVSSACRRSGKETKPMKEKEANPTHHLQLQHQEIIISVKIVIPN